MALKKLFHTKLLALEDGSYDVFYYKKRYLLSKQTELNGKLIKLYAEELGDTDFISLNYYPLIGDGLLRPCEMPEKKVIDFVLSLKKS
ncbi:peptide methionine sulfoxide reductase [Sulfurimonas aquatica]|uniref:Peptide methionine sulfoxide reductase n=2 Tax=Sulfurimonas aquatica TaxID=2672570 RepID=A0A975B2T3_9BACT|nr:peptide methionine sulfoxide reductase [Sulfurimonas aquatica]